MAHLGIIAPFAACTALALGGMPAAAQLQNGSFETGAAYAPAPPFYLIPGTPAPWYETVYTPDLYDNTGADGWDLSGIPLYDNMFKGMPAQHGNRFIGFAGSPDFGGEAFAQTTSPLIAGQVYEISTYMSVDDSGRGGGFGGPYTGRGEVDVFLDGVLIGTLPPNTASFAWEPRSFTFTAPATSNADFEFSARIDPVTGEASYIGLDAIDITVVPTPGTLGLLGLAGVAACRRRR